MIDSSHIKNLAKELGFDLCGVTIAAPMHPNKAHFDTWLSEGYGEPLGYMSRYYDLRFDPSTLLDGARTVIVCGVNYKNEYSLSRSSVPTPRIASYALNRDYHKTIRKSLKNLLRTLQDADPSLQGRCFVDSAPLLEKQLAVNCGLGWIGKQSLLITPQYGSFVLLGEIIINDCVDHYDTPLSKDRCGSCRACIDSCPVGAIVENKRMVDSRLCISCRTVEVEDTSSESLNGWIFGCDECQSCCPYNQTTPQHQNPNFSPISTPLSIEAWGQLSEDEFDKIYGTTPLKRAGLDRIKRLIRKM